GLHFLIHRLARALPDRKDVRIDRAIARQLETHLLEIPHKIRIVHRHHRLHTMIVHFRHVQPRQAPDVIHDAVHTHGPLYVPALAHVMHLMPRRDQHLERARNAMPQRRDRRRSPCARQLQCDPAVPYGRHDRARIRVVTRILVLPEEDRAHYAAYLGGRWLALRTQRVEHHVRFAFRALRPPRLVARTLDDPRTVALVEPDARAVLATPHRIRFQLGRIGSYFQVQSE